MVWHCTRGKPLSELMLTNTSDATRRLCTWTHRQMVYTGRIWFLEIFHIHLHFDWNFTEVCYVGSNWLKFSIHSGKWMNMPQANNRTNLGTIHSLTYVTKPQLMQSTLRFLRYRVLSNNLFFKEASRSVASARHRSSLNYSLWPSDAIWRRNSGSTLAQVLPDCTWNLNRKSS